MKPRSSALAAALACACALVAPSARADNMDPATERLVIQPQGLPAGQTCQTMAGNPELAIQLGKSPNAFTCAPAHAAFANYMSELGFAIAPSAFHPARTTGLGGFALTLEASFTKINQDASSTEANGQQIQYWHQATRGPTDPNTNAFGITNKSPDSLIQIYSLKARKGLPLGFEVAGALGTIANSGLWTVGADIRWAPLEGFRTGPLGYLPDLGVGGGVRTIAGTGKYTLTTVGFDAQISKRFNVADMSQLTPYVGYQRLWVFGDSTIIDSTPNVDPLAQCGYQGPNPQTGTPTCANKLSNGADANSDFNNNWVFNKVRTQRHRGLFGLNYRYEFLYLAGQFAIDLTPPSDENPVLQSTRQWTTSIEAGVFF